MIKSPTALIAYLQKHIDEGTREDICIDDCYGWTLSFDSAKNSKIYFQVEYYHIEDCSISFKNNNPVVRLGDAFEGGGGEKVLETLIKEYMVIEAQVNPILSLADEASNIAFGTDYEWIKVPKLVEPEHVTYENLYETLKAHHKTETEFLIKMCRDLAKLYVEK